MTQVESQNLQITLALAGTKRPDRLLKNLAAYRLGASHAFNFCRTTPLRLLLGSGVAAPPIRRNLPRQEASFSAMPAAAASRSSGWRAPKGDHDPQEPRNPGHEACALNTQIFKQGTKRIFIYHK
jgi:hypothetical protein